MTVEIISDQSARKYGTGLGSNSRPLDLQVDSLPTVDLLVEFVCFILCPIIIQEWRLNAIK